MRPPSTAASSAALGRRVAPPASPTAAGPRTRPVHPADLATVSTPAAHFPRRTLAALLAGAVAAALPTLPARAAPPGFKKDMTKSRSRRTYLPDDAFTKGEKGLLYIDEKVGTGPLAGVGDRVAVHYEARWKGITFQTSRQGVGVTGGTPLGFDVGATGAGGTLAGLDLGVRGMRVGGLRVLRVPPELAYGKSGIDEIPGNATLDFTVELLSIKTNALGYRVKLVEG